MGFGPTTGDFDAAITAIRDIVQLLYPERATAPALQTLETIARTLLEAKAPLSFATIGRFLADPAWRQWLLERAPHSRAPWQAYREQAIAPEALDPDFAAFLVDRLTANDTEA